MKYNLIFYIAKKTSYCERAVRKALSGIGGEPYRVTAAVTPVALGEEVGDSLRICPLTVIIGGFVADGDENLQTVLSRVFSNSSLTLENMRKLTADSGQEGYIVRYKTQILLALPDNPGDITQLCSKELLAYIEDKVKG
ncbi:hypothetical protein [Ruminococcus sp.]|uniref:hypothetical protein n=1 Tax=Ruminococcus sp. TaxID=41978 RepID=UPI003890A6EC